MMILTCRSDFAATDSDALMTPIFQNVDEDLSHRGEWAFKELYHLRMAVLRWRTYNASVRRHRLLLGVVYEHTRDAVFLRLDMK